MRLPNKRLKGWRALTSREELRLALAALPFYCGSHRLRPQALRPQLKRNPLGRTTLRSCKDLDFWCRAGEVFEPHSVGRGAD